MITIRIEGLPERAHHVHSGDIATELLEAFDSHDADALGHVIHRLVGAFVRINADTTADLLKTFKEQIVSELSDVLNDLTAAVDANGAAVAAVDAKVEELEAAQNAGEDTAPIVAALRAQVDELKGNTDALAQATATASNTPETPAEPEVPTEPTPTDDGTGGDVTPPTDETTGSGDVSGSAPGDGTVGDDNSAANTDAGTTADDGVVKPGANSGAPVEDGAN